MSPVIAVIIIEALPTMSGYLQQCSPQWQLSAQLNLLPTVMQTQQ